VCAKRLWGVGIRGRLLATGSGHCKKERRVAADVLVNPPVGAMAAPLAPTTTSVRVIDRMSTRERANGVPLDLLRLRRQLVFRCERPASSKEAPTQTQTQQRTPTPNQSRQAATRPCLENCKCSRSEAAAHRK